MPGKGKNPAKMQAWIDARERHRLSHAHVQMARELGMNPNKLGGLDNHQQERWKASLPEFIALSYEKRFGRNSPEQVRSIEEVIRDKARKKDARRRAKAARRDDAHSGATESG